MRRFLPAATLLVLLAAPVAPASAGSNARHESVPYTSARGHIATGPAECGADHYAVGPGGGMTRSTVRFHPAAGERWVSIGITDDLPGQTIVAVLWQPILSEVHDLATVCGRTATPIRIRPVTLHLNLYTTWSTEGPSTVTQGVVNATFFGRLPLRYRQG
jgi:hypothetical protein